MTTPLIKTPAHKMFGNSRRQFYFERQAGICYLQITPDCRDRDGEMVITPHGGRLRASATWEHLKPKEAFGRRITANNVLLACHGCNGTKGGELLALPEHLQLAARLWEDWVLFHQALEAAGIAKKETRQLAKHLKAEARAPQRAKFIAKTVTLGGRLHASQWQHLAKVNPEAALEKLLEHQHSLPPPGDADRERAYKAHVELRNRIWDEITKKRYG